jgi:uncharacterized membrane protein HdeD (DUF308 family)
MEMEEAGTDNKETSICESLTDASLHVSALGSVLQAATTITGIAVALLALIPVYHPARGVPVLVLFLGGASLYASIRAVVELTREQSKSVKEHAYAALLLGLLLLPLILFFLLAPEIPEAILRPFIRNP